MRSAGACSILLAVLLPAGRARAREPPRTSSLGWVRLAGAESCAGQRAVAEAVEKRLGRAVFVAPTQADVAVEGRIERAGRAGGWHATITLTDERGAVLGTRELTSDAADCRALDARIALALALMIDPDAGLSAPPPPAPAPAPAPHLEPPAAPDPAPSVPAAPEGDPPAPPPPAPPRPWRSGLQIGFASPFGMLPHAAPMATLRLHVVPPRGPGFEAGVSVADASWEGGSFALTYGSLSVCPLAISVTGTSFFACAGTQVGSLRYLPPGPGTYQYEVVFDLATEVHVRRALFGPVFSAAGLGFLVPLDRDRFWAGPDRSSPVFLPPPVAGTAEVAFGVFFP